MKKLHKFILYTLKGQCKSQYVGRDSDKLDMKADIIKCIKRCKKFITLKMDLNTKKKSQAGKHWDDNTNDDGGGRGKGGECDMVAVTTMAKKNKNNSSGSGNNNICQLNNSKHPWKDCHQIGSVRYS